MSSTINCKVSNCDHWKEMQCTAEKIEVSMQDDGSETCSSDSTCCNTFTTKKC